MSIAFTCLVALSDSTVINCVILSVTNADWIFYWYIQPDITLSVIVHLSYSIRHQILNVRLSADIQYFIGHVVNMYLILLGEPCNVITTYNPLNAHWNIDMPKGVAVIIGDGQRGLNWSRGPLRLWGCDTGVSNSSLLAWQQGVLRRKVVKYRTICELLKLQKFNRQQ